MTVTLEDELLTTQEVADLLRLAEVTVRIWRYERKGPKFLKVGRRVRYRRSEVEAWIASQEKATTP